MVSMFLDGELDPPATEGLVEHLSSCDQCSDLAVTFEADTNLLKTAGVTLIPPPLDRRIKTDLAAAAQPSALALRRMKLATVPSLALSFTIAGAFTGMMLVQQLHPSSGSPTTATPGAHAQLSKQQIVTYTLRSRVYRSMDTDSTVPLMPRA